MIVMPSSLSVLWPWDFQTDISLSEWLRFPVHKRKLKRQILVILQTFCLLCCKIHLFSMFNPSPRIFHSVTFSLEFRLLFPGIKLYFTFFSFCFIWNLRRIWDLINLFSPLNFQMFFYCYFVHVILSYLLCPSIYYFIPLNSIISSAT